MVHHDIITENTLTIVAYHGKNTSPFENKRRLYAQ